MLQYLQYINDPINFYVQENHLVAILSVLSFKPPPYHVCPLLVIIVSLAFIQGCRKDFQVVNRRTVSIMNFSSSLKSGPTKTRPAGPAPMSFVHDYSNMDFSI